MLGPIAPPSSESLIKATGLSKVYRLGATNVTALSGVDLQIRKGEFLAIAGASGSGKSTLLNLIGCIEHPTAGILQFENLDLTALSSNALADFRAHQLGFIFQTFNLFSVLTAYENIDFPLDNTDMSPQERKVRVDYLLEQMGLAAVAHHQPAQLSGGQRQRVAIARALAAKPSLIVADEPSANLDHATGAEIIQILKDLNRKTGVTLVLATHDAGIMGQADRVIELLDGHILKETFNDFKTSPA